MTTDRFYTLQQFQAFGVLQTLFGKLMSLLERILSKWSGWHLFVLLFAVAIDSCDLTSPSDFTYDFILNFTKGIIVSQPMQTPTGQGDFVARQWDVGGEKRDAIITVAESRIVFEIPANRGGEMLFFGIGMGYLIGDGAEGLILIDQGTGSRIDTVYRRFLNPAGNGSDRGWFDESLDLSGYDNKAIRVAFVAMPGPAGDATADWIAWSTPKLTLPRR